MFQRMMTAIFVALLLSSRMAAGEIHFRPSGETRFPYRVEIDLGTQQEQILPVSDGGEKIIKLPDGPHTIDVHDSIGLNRSFLIKESRQASPYPIVLGSEKVVVVVEEPLLQFPPFFGRKPHKTNPQQQNVVVSLEGNFHLPFEVVINGKTFRSPDGRAPSLREVSLQPGKNAFLVKDIRGPSPLFFRVEIAEGESGIRSGRWHHSLGAIEHDVQSGQKVRIIVEEPIESYNCAFRTFHGVDYAVVYNDPYLHHKLSQGEYKGTGPWQNTMLYFADPTIGNKGQAAALAALVAQEVSDQTLQEKNEYRITGDLTAHFCWNTAGRVDERLKNIPLEEWEKEFDAAMTYVNRKPHRLRDTIYFFFESQQFIDGFEKNMLGGHLSKDEILEKFGNDFLEKAKR
jgi:hypothetical protein